MNRHPWVAWAWLLIAIQFPAAVAANDQAIRGRVHELAERRDLPADAPQASDVIMRSLTLRVGKNERQYDTFRAMADFHVTRLEWAYIRDQAAISKFRESGRLFGGAASSAMSHILLAGETATHADLACVNLRGEPVVPTWKRTWRPPGSWWMCVNNPTLERCYVEYLKSCLDAGARVMQRDEPSGNARATDWGGCFCDHCVRAFRDYLQEQKEVSVDEWEQLGIDDPATFDYRAHLVRQQAPVGDDFRSWNGGRLKQAFLDFQTEATIAFHQRTRRVLDEYAGRRVAISCNNGCRRWTPIELLFDWCFGELSYRHAQADFIHGSMRQAAAFGRCQVITMPKKADREDLEAWHRLTRQTIATAYACGGHCMVPWDVYMPGDAPRYFGTPGQYADLFGFIRANARYLDGYEYAGASGPGIDCDLHGSTFPILLNGGRNVGVFLRAQSDRADSAVVAHLVDWSENPQPFRLTLNPLAFFGDRPLKMTLRTPTAYDEASHRAAQATRSFDELSKTTVVERGYSTSVSLPALRPWGILVIEPDDTRAGGVWQPAIQIEPSDYFREKIPVRLATASAQARIFFTTDGTEPTRNSAQYAEPLEISDSTTLKAVAALPSGLTSPVASTTLNKRAGTPEPTSPGIPALKKHLRLWLAADALSLSDGAVVTEWTARTGPHAVAESHETLDGSVTQPPAFAADAINGRPAIRFDGIDDSLVVPRFATEYLAGTDFTVFMVTESEDPGFGMCGNGIWGGGGIPRLYMQRSAFRYDELDSPVKLQPTSRGPTISVFTHDGRATIGGAVNGVPSDSVSSLPVVSEFGSGGNLAIPFWSGNKNCQGDMAEIVVFDRQLTGEERIGIEAYLADKYAIPYERRWD